jgi:hypothetical protein
MHFGWAGWASWTARRQPSRFSVAEPNVPSSLGTPDLVTFTENLPVPNPPTPKGDMAAAGWLRRAASAAALPRMPSGFSLMPTPPPAPLPEAQSLVLPGLGAAIAPAMELMAVPKKKVSSLPPNLRCFTPFTCIVVLWFW